MPGTRFHEAPESLRLRLKQPLGDLIRDDRLSERLIRDKIFSNLKKGEIAVTVGDRTTEKITVEFGLEPNLEIIDTIEKRAPRPAIDWQGAKDMLMNAVNPPGGISDHFLRTLEKSFAILMQDPEAKVRIVIQGEEDLLVLPVLAFYPGRAIVLYGQPNEGMVIADSVKLRHLSREYLLEMGINSIGPVQ